MSTKLYLISVLAASLTLHGAAMPTEAEVEKAVPKVERMLASEKVALESGKMTRAEVTAAAMKLAADADDEAAKLLLMKGAFILQVKDGDLEKAVKTMNALETAIADMPPQIVTNIIETALLGLPNKTANGARLYRLLDEAKVAAKVTVADGENLKAVVDGYTWSYRVKNGEAEIAAEKDGKPCCAVSPKPIGHVAIPLMLGGAKVTSIGQEAFRECQGLVAVTIPPSVTNIGDVAFYSCDIKSVNIPASVTSIGTQAFSDNSELMSFSVEESNPSYSSRNGLLCTKDGTTLISGTSGDVEIPSSVTSIEGWAFTGRRKLTSVMIPPSVTNIGRTAFRWCTGLKTITIPPAVTRLDSNVFRNCSGLTSVVIPSNVTSIGWCAFWKCSGLKSVTIPSSVTTIGGNAFGCCGELKSVSIPESVTSIGREAFRWCRALETVTIPSNLKILEQGVFASTGLKSVTIPTNVTSIGRGAVAGCVGLTAMTIPDSITNIGIDAFRGSGRVKSVTIPSSVRSISDHAFAVCGELTTVTMRGERPTAPNNIFQDCAKLMSIYVPANAKSWVGMTEWQGIPLVFDGAQQGQTGEQREAERTEQRAQLLAIQDELKRVRGMKDSSPAVRAAVESILKGMIKVPGRDFWLSATELTQEQWEPIMEFNLSQHKGAKLPIEMISRDDCDVFLEKFNQTKEVLSSGLEFRLPELEEWKYAAWAGSAGNGCWIKPGMIGNVLDMAWVKENSSNETHAVAMKAANAFGFYDMLGNVWEWLAGDAPGGRGALKGCAFSQIADKCTWNQNLYLSKIQRVPLCGLRLAAHKKDFLWRPLWGGLRRPGSADNGQQGGSLRARRLQRRQEAQKTIHQEKVDGYTWSFRVQNGEAEIVAENGGKFACAVSPTPTGDITIPSTLGGSKVTSIWRNAFKDCHGLKSLTIPQSVRDIGSWAFCGCSGLTSVTMPENLTKIEQGVFYHCERLASVTLPQRLVSIGANAFMGCRKLAPVTIPLSVTNIGEAAFAYCLEMQHIDVEVGNQVFASIDGVVYTKDRAELVVCPSGMTSVTIPDSVMKIRNGSFTGCEGLMSLTIPSAVKSIGAWAFSGSRLTSLPLPQGLSDIEGATFWGCHNLTSVTIPDSVTSIGGNAFRWCGKLTSVTIPKGVKSIGGEAFYDCGGLTSITMCGERPDAPSNVFKGCRKLKSIHVPANAKSWAGMREWQGIPLVFDAK